MTLKTHKGSLLADPELKRELLDSWLVERQEAFVKWAIHVRGELEASGYDPENVQRCMEHISETAVNTHPVLSRQLRKLRNAWLASSFRGTQSEKNR